MELLTARLRLRDFEQSDAEGVHCYAQDPEVVEFMEWGPNNWEQTQDFVRRAVDTKDAEPRTAYDLVCTLLDGTLIGAVGLYVDHGHRKAVLGYCFNKNFWGQGYCYEAAKALTDFGFAELQLHRIEATCDLHNYASGRVLTKLGMIHEGCLKENMYIRGLWRSTYMYGMLADRGSR